MIFSALCNPLYFLALTSLAVANTPLAENLVSRLFQKMWRCGLHLSFKLFSTRLQIYESGGTWLSTKTLLVICDERGF